MIFCREMLDAKKMQRCRQPRRSPFRREDSCKPRRRRRFKILTFSQYDYRSIRFISDADIDI
jgi:hypothetical protein